MSSLLSTLAAGVVLLASSAAAQSATLYGQVTDALDQQPIASAQIEALDAYNLLRVVRSTHTDASGRYVMDGLPAGAYLVRAAPPAHLLHLTDAQSATDCSHAEDLHRCAQRLYSQPSATGSLVLGESSSREVDIRSAPAAQLQGQVQLANTGSLSRISVQVGSGNDALNVPVDARGMFSLDHITPGNYAIGICAMGAICRDAIGVEFDAFGADHPRLTLPLAARRTTTLPALTLRPGAAITLAAPLSLPLFMDSHNLPRITVWREGDAPLEIDLANASDTLRSMRPGRYRLLFGTMDDPRWHARWHDGTDCTRAHCAAEKVTPIVLEPGETRTEVGVALQSRQRISGQILQDGTGQPIPGMFVSVLHWQELGPEAHGLYIEALVAADQDGRYVIEGLAPDAYVLIASNGSAPAPWLSERWPGVRCTSLDLDACLPTLQNHFHLLPDQQAGQVDFTPELGGTISGSFTGIAPDRYGLVEITHTDSGRPVLSSHSIIPGDRPWRSEPLPVGQYRVTGVESATNLLPIRRQVFPLLDCPADGAECVPASAARIAVGAGRDAVGVDFQFGPVPVQEMLAAKAGAARTDSTASCLSFLPNDHALSCRMQLRPE